ncbi:lytic transglycosylase domain-containing protein [Edwardsiella ictaluri]|uniref:transglycosylase SLT domain-containing protein n=1 Tax=Edwardsiella ictaluri TaxID=67780 RepID=UPI00030726DF|nr:transglycosylase SLT domain-containing protein [Edwardsiella ictaluri]AVZ81949.1 lytic transglycosylase domain-containing protein [Edwardsiella ictaluri]EKS7764707.1 transglycosylase SLT domain-containing protein [Edwardsiella ictaluri]EKS7771540.1 transglycosylase SLT domain-containing protein [Edwardsiella ictaluri]EKS7774717.1 transglycosylase SLT domain-containing protein [Edwardsiella ictaluri]EKS7778002.1 transglycosylase SLT domain-containing protein [Edwardsiella ictaluri]
MAYRRILIALMLAGSGNATAAGGTVPEGYVRVAVAHKVPPEVLYSVSLAETAMAPRSIAAVVRQQANLPDVARPWPWTINVAGKEYRYSSRLEAWQALQVFMSRYSLKRIDVGLAQVNLGWNGHHFTSTWAAFDPYTNLNAAAAILRECWERKPGSWLDAAGCYHHPAGGQAAVRYKTIVKRHLVRISGSIRQSPPPLLPQTIVANAPEPGFIWTEPGSEP